MRRAAALALALVACEEAPPPKAPPAPEPDYSAVLRIARANEEGSETKALERKWEAEKARKRAAKEDAGKEARAEAIKRAQEESEVAAAKAKPEPAPEPAWTPALRVESLLTPQLAPRERAVWAAYAALPAAKRTPQALEDAAIETENMCRTRRECRVHNAVLLSYRVQGRHAGSWLLRVDDEVWVHLDGGADACFARYGEMRSDRMVREDTVGLFCGNLATSSVTGRKILRDQEWRRWLHSMFSTESPAILGPA